ncbi:MAG TPA: hypothetical protein VK961_19495, partial [Chthoniobacter sp.]|nr:hypothetical protein [Chthoniobacter sp.]
MTDIHRHSRFRRNFLLGVSLLALSVELHAAVTLSGNTADPSTLGTGNYNIGIDATGVPNPGTMLIDGGSAVVGQIIKLGVNQNALGVATVTGTNSSLSATQLYLGFGSTTITNTQGTLNILSGATVATSTNVSYVAYGASSTGTINVTGTSDGTLTGAPSTLTLGTTTYFGYGSNASGTLNITDGGFVGVAPMGRNGGPIVLGWNAGSTGTVLVSGTNSSYIGKGNLYVGGGGQGIINVTNGGLLSQTSTSAATTTIGGANYGGSGTVTVSGPGSAFNTSGNFDLGGLGTGALNVTNGATAQGIFNTAYLAGGNFGTGQIGSSTGSSGTVNVSGAGSIWTTVGNFYIGNLGAGTLNIQSGGTVNSAIHNVGALTDYENLTLAYASGSSATVLVDGPGSAWNVTSTGGGTISTGSGSTTITVRNGGTANLADLFLNGDSTITITGANSVMTTGRLILSSITGVASYPTITISNGGVLNNTQLASLAQNNTAGQPVGGAVSVDGNTSQWNVTGNLIAGRSGGTGLITLKNGGTLSVYTDTTHQATGIGDGAIVVGDTPYNATPSVGILYIGTGAAAGIVNAASVGGYFSGNTVIPAADSTIIFNHNQNNYYFTNNGASSGTGVAITGSTKINVVAGTTVLTANNTNVGDTLVTGGSLIVNNPGGAGTSGTGSGNVTVGIHGTLGGAGRITPADVTISSGGSGNVTTSHSVDVLGILSPGDISSFGASIPGTLTIDSGISSAAHILTLESGATLQFDLGAGLTSDRISLLNGSVADLLFNSNIIDFTDLTGGHLASGDYVLFSAGDLADYSGLFSGTNNAVTGLSIGSGLEA